MQKSIEPLETWMIPKKVTISKSTIAEAAMACFQRFGVHRTSMSDIAAKAGVSRQTIYRLFSTKTELLEYVADERIKIIGQTLAPYFSKVNSLQEALVEGSIKSIKAGAGDTLLPEIIEHSGNHQLSVFLYGGSTDARTIMNALWGPILDRARATGELRSGITNDRAIEWIRNIHTLMVIRNDYDEEAQRSIMMDFLVPSLINQNAISPTMAPKN